MLTAFKECGPSSFLAVLVAGVALAVAIAALVSSAMRVRAAKVVALTAVGVALLPALIGIGGTMIGKRHIEEALASIASDPGAVDPAQVARIRAQGELEAATCTTIGGSATALPMLLAAGALVLAVALRPKERA